MQQQMTFSDYLGISGHQASKTVKEGRVSRHINRRVTQSIFRAFDYAKHIGTPLNLYVVINLHENNGKSAAKIFSDIRERFRDWLFYIRKTRPHLGVSPTYAYSLENPKDQHPHVNWTVHIPAGLKAEFEKKLVRWIEKAQGVCGPSDCVVEPINLAYDKKLAKYIVKGTDPLYVKHFYLSDEASEQGSIYGKRAGVSPSIGPAVRREAKFKPWRQNYWKKAA